MRRGIIVVLAVGTLVSTGRPASASCSKPPLPEILEVADGAFVGELLIQLPGPDRYHVVNIFNVEHVLKGELGSEVEVLSAFPWGGGLSVEEGLRYGLILWRNEGSWSSNRCSQLYSDELLQAVQPQKAPAARPVPPRPPAPTSAWPWVLAIAVVGAAAVMVRRTAWSRSSP